MKLIFFSIGRVQYNGIETNIIQLKHKACKMMPKNTLTLNLRYKIATKNKHENVEQNFLNILCLILNLWNFEIFLKIKHCVNVIPINIPSFRLIQIILLQHT